MEVFSSFLLLVLTWTAEKTFCKSASWNMSSATENQIPSMTRGDEEKVLFDARQVETTDGGGEVEMMDNDRRLHTTGPGRPGGPDGKEVAETMTLTTDEGGEVEMMDNNRRLHKTGPGGPGGPDSKEEAETMTLIDDMWLSEDQLPEKMRKKTGGEKAGLFRNGKVNRRYRWPNKILYYRLTGRFSSWQRQWIEETLRRLERKIGSNCVKFRRRNRRYAVRIRQEGSKCSATVGYVRSRTGQRMSLGRGCWGRGTIMHEFLHSLGIHHTQNRWDRDKYVQVNKWNVHPDNKHNFEEQPKREADFFGLPYDYDSVMHYRGSDFARNPNIRTIVTKDWRKQSRIGQRRRLSEGDVRLIRKMYQCN